MIHFVYLLNIPLEGIVKVNDLERVCTCSSSTVDVFVGSGKESGKATCYGILNALDFVLPKEIQRCSDVLPLVA